MQYRLTISLAVFSTLMMRMGVKHPRLLTVPLRELLHEGR